MELRETGQVTGGVVDDVDAGFRFGISPDGLMAYLTLLRPRSGNGRVSTIELVARAMEQHQVVFGIDQERIARIVSALNRGSLDGLIPDAGKPDDPADKRFYVIAKGRAAQDGVDGHVHWVRNPSQLEWRVGLGDEIARYTSPVVGSSGVNVRGLQLKFRQGVERAPILGPGIAVQPTESGVIYRARWLGTVLWDEETLDVGAGLNVSADGLLGSMPLFARTSAGREITSTEVKASLEQLGICCGIDEALIQAALARISSAEDELLEEPVIVAAGEPPGEPLNASLEVVYEGKQVGQTLERGRIDFRERNYPWNVTAGEALGAFFEPRAGNPGRSIRGELIPGIEPQPMALELLGIHRDADGKLVAERDGALLIEGHRLAIVDLFTVNGDVGPKTGNVRTHSAVHVCGYVTAGFSVESGQAVIVDENIESATVRAAGEVVVKGGIRGPASDVIVQGGLTAGFLENTELKVAGDVIVNRSIINSILQSDGRVFVGDRRSATGAIIGGQIHSLFSVQAVSLGSANYARTQIVVGVSQDQREKLDHVRAEIKEKHADIERLVQLEQRYKREPAKLSLLLPKLKMTRETVFEEMGELKDQERQLLAEIQASKEAQVIVYRNVYPGVLIMINQFVFDVREELGRGRFVLGEDGVAFEPRRRV